MKAEYTEYDNFRWINCNRWSDAKAVDALAEELVQGITSRKRNDYRINMKVLILDLYQSYLCDPEQYLAYSRSPNHYSKTGPDHPYIKNPRVSYDYLLGCIDHISPRLVRNKKGGQFVNPETNTVHSFVSRMRPLHPFMDLVNQYKISPEMIGAYVEDEVLVLKGKPVVEHYQYEGQDKTRKVKPKLAVPKSTTAKRMARIIRQYNTFDGKDAYRR